jgi:hypothetical protein
VGSGRHRECAEQRLSLPAAPPSGLLVGPPPMTFPCLGFLEQIGPFGRECDAPEHGWCSAVQLASMLRKVAQNIEDGGAAPPTSAGRALSLERGGNGVADGL